MEPIQKLALLAGIAGMCFASGPLTPTAVGSSTLPYQTSWEKATLQPGNYTFAMAPLGFGGENAIMLRQGTSTVAIILVQAFTICDSSGWQFDPNCKRTLRLAPLGRTYYFFKRKQKREMLRYASVRDLSHPRLRNMKLAEGPNRSARAALVIPSASALRPDLTQRSPHFSFSRRTSKKSIRGGRINWMIFDEARQITRSPLSMRWPIWPSMVRYTASWVWLST